MYETGCELQEAVDLLVDDMRKSIDTFDHAAEALLKRAKHEPEVSRRLERYIHGMTTMTAGIWDWS